MARVRVEWDVKDNSEDETTASELGLAEIVEVPEEVIESDKKDDGALADWLSDNYGFCVNSVSILE